METSMERECSALGGLFQQIIGDLKNNTPIWEDFIAKATKLHSCLRATVQAIGSYLDSFQKIADAATNTRGATKEIGTALTRLCLRHKAVETRMKTFTSTIMDCLILPLQEKLEDWKKNVINLDKEHAKEYKKARAELKKRSTDTLRLQKKAKKGKCGELQRKVETSLQDVSERRHLLEEAEKRALRAALTEERSRFCLFVGFFKPVVSEEVAMLSELTHIQEITEQLDKISSEPYILPPSTEQVIQDLKGSDGFWTFQTPPSSPSSLGSRKSSMCSISSLNSSSSGSSKSQNSPHHYWQRSTSQNGNLPKCCLPRLSSVSSQDSGFRSQDALHSKNLLAEFKVLNTSEHSDNSNSSTPSTPQIDLLTTIATPPTTSTWPNLQETLQFERAASAIMKDRPHTISTAYERGHHRPSLTVYTFHAPETSLSQPSSPVSASAAVSSSSSSTSPPLLSNSSTPVVSPQGLYSRPPIPQRCSSLERPFIPSKSIITNGRLIKADVTKNVLSKLQANFSDIHQAPVYVNMSELATLAATKAQEMAINLPPPPPELTTTFMKNEQDNNSTLGERALDSSNRCGRQYMFGDKISSNEGLNCEIFRNNTLRKGSLDGQKPSPPIRRTASITSNKPSFPVNVETTGNLENLPPPPSFLLESEGNTSEINVKDVKSKLENVSSKKNAISQGSNIGPSNVRVAETVRTLTELKHTPASPIALKRPTSAIRSQSAERRESIGSGLIAALSAKIAPNLSPRHTRRHSEDMMAKNLGQGNTSSLNAKLLQRGMSSPGQNFLESLNAKLALQQQVQQNQLKIHNAARVRQLYAEKTISDPTVCHDSLMEQIKKGTSLKKTRAVNDRSAPKIH